MPNIVSTEVSVIESGIRCCKTAIQELEKATKELWQNYQQAGSNGWGDQKYSALGDIVDECRTALTRPIGELEECVEKLEDLKAAVLEYQQVSL